MSEEVFRGITERKIGTLSGIGVKRAEAFSRLKIYTIGDLLRHFPRGYQNRGNIRLLSEAVLGESCSYLLTIGTQPKSATLKNRMTITKFTAFDESGTVVITYFNSRFIEKAFHVGETFRFWGRVTKEKGRLAMSSPAHELYLDGIELPDLVPIYPSASGLTQKVISEAVGSALQLISDCNTPEILPEKFSSELDLPSHYEALRAIHCASHFSDIEAARRYFSAEELYLFSLGLSLTKNRKRSGKPPKIKKTELEDFKKLLDFTLTSAQERSIKEIFSDMTRGDMPMSRLLSGDVGSGKTAVAAAALYLSAESGYQSALMAPTEILAEQHYRYLSEIFGGLGYKTELLIGSLGASQKKRIKSLLKSGEIDIIIGTHALITPDTEFNNLGLVVTDEQHRFGVNQRARLGGEGEISPHVLVMSATPIPRTLALILYGELALSMLDELPAGRQRVDTFVVDESYRNRLNAFIEKQVSGGGQVYVVCPTVEEKEEDSLEGDIISFAPDGRAEMSFDKPKLKSAVQYAENLASELSPDISIALIHGRMSGKEKAEVMKRFSCGEVDVLVSTTVIEVGVNVPNASLMIIENAERFGLAQLHQLRGRVGRGSRKAYCVLVSSGGGEKAEKRLSVMKNTYDGYKIAEYDLEIRGPGDYFPSKDGSARQHGSFGGIISADMNLLKKAMLAAEETLSLDKTLSLPQNSYAAEKMRELFSADERSMQ
ncbi:MAG: ATP-dependent DNA helicase RecG [Clostridia bacterium]|nr:ATP-dependent DNA helicase RecG [Clostridia bacterium]